LLIVITCIAMVFFFTSCTIQSAIEQKKTVEEILGKIGESEDKTNSRGQPATMKEDEVEDNPLKDVYKDYFLVGAAINGYSVETAAINHPGMAAILKKTLTVQPYLI